MGAETVGVAVAQALGYASAGTAAATTGATVATAVAAAVYSIGLSFLAGKILASALSPDNEKEVKQVTRDAVEYRKLIYGTRIVGGAMVFAESSSDRTGRDEMQFILAITGHPVEDITGVYLNTDYIPIAGSPWHPEKEYYGNYLHYDTSMRARRTKRAGYNYETFGKISASDAFPFWRKNSNSPDPVEDAQSAGYFSVDRFSAIDCVFPDRIGQNPNNAWPGKVDLTMNHWADTEKIHFNSEAPIRIIKSTGWADATDYWFGGTENRPSKTPFDSITWEGELIPDYQHWHDYIWNQQRIAAGESSNDNFEKLVTYPDDPGALHKSFWDDVHAKEWSWTWANHRISSWNTPVTAKGAEWSEISQNDRDTGDFLDPWVNGRVYNHDAKENLGIWIRDEHKLTNCSFIHFRFDHSEKYEWRSALPNVQMVVKGKRIYDPRDDSTTQYYESGTTIPGRLDIWKGWDKLTEYTGEQRQGQPYTYTHSNNWALVCLDYLTDKEMGLGVPFAEIDMDSFVEAANVSDEPVQIPNSSPAQFQPRYIVDAALTLDISPIEIMEQLINCGSGILSYSQGKYVLKAGKYSAPESDSILTEDDLAGGIQINTSVGSSSLFNKVTGTYLKRNKKNKEAFAGTIVEEIPHYEPVEYGIVNPVDSQTQLTYEDIDGIELIETINFPFVCNEFQAQRLARIKLERARNSLSVTATLKLSNLVYSVGDTVRVHFPTVGFTEELDKTFLITDITLTSDLNVEVSMVEEFPELYDYSFTDFISSDPAPNIQAYDRASGYPPESPDWNIAASDPTFGDAIVPSYSVDQDGSINTSLQLYWRAFYSNEPTITIVDPINSDGVSLIEVNRDVLPPVVGYEVQYGEIIDSSQVTPNLRVARWYSGGVIARRSIDGALPFVQGGLVIDDIDGNSLSQDPLVSGLVRFDFRVRALSAVGTKSAWVYYFDSVLNTDGRGYEVIKDNTPPADIAGATATSNLPSVTFTIDNSNNAGERDLNSLRVRYSTDINNPNAVGARTVDLAVPSVWDPSSNIVEVTWVPPDNQQYYVWLRYVDRSGNTSENYFPDITENGLSARIVTASEYYIKPLTSTALNSNVTQILLQAKYSNGTGNVTDPNIVMVEAGTGDVLNVANGYLSPSDGNYAIVEPDNFTGGMTVELINILTDTIYDTINLVDTGDVDAAGVYGSFQTNEGLTNVQDKNGQWTPLATTNTVDVIFYKAGDPIATGQIVITRNNTDGTLTAAEIATTGDITITFLNNGTRALTVIAEETNASSVVSETFSSLFSGVDPNVYYIKALNGTAIKSLSEADAGKQLTFEARVLNSSGDTLLTGGNIRLYNGADLVSTDNGYPSPSDGYTAVFDSNTIDDSELLSLEDRSDPENIIIYQTMSIVDVNDGVDGTQGVIGFIEEQLESGENLLGPVFVQFSDKTWLETADRDFNVTFILDGVVVARDAIRFSLGLDYFGTPYTLDRGSIVFWPTAPITHTDGDLNNSRITYTHQYGTGIAASTNANSPYSTITVKATYDHDGFRSVLEKTIYIVQYGADAGPLYYIKRLNGETIRNSVGTLNFEARRLFNELDELIDTENAMQLYWEDDPSTGLGFTTSVTSSDLADNQSRELQLKTDSDVVLDSAFIINITDVQFRTFTIQPSNSVYNGTGTDNFVAYVHGFNPAGNAEDIDGIIRYRDVDYVVPKGPMNFTNIGVYNGSVYILMDTGVGGTRFNTELGTRPFIARYSSAGWIAYDDDLTGGQVAFNAGDLWADINLVVIGEMNLAFGSILGWTAYNNARHIRNVVEEGSTKNTGSLANKDQVQQGDIQAEALDTISLFTREIRPPALVNSLDTDYEGSDFPYEVGNLVVLTTTSVLYKLVGTVGDPATYEWKKFLDNPQLFDTAIAPVQRVTIAPTANPTSTGDSPFQYLAEDDSPYLAGTMFRWDETNTEWTAGIPADLIVGELQANQISANAIGTENLNVTELLTLFPRGRSLNSDPLFDNQNFGGNYPWRIATLDPSVNSTDPDYETNVRPIHPVYSSSINSPEVGVPVEAYSGSRYLYYKGTLGTAVATGGTTVVGTEDIPLDINKNYYVSFARRRWSGGDRMLYVGIDFYDVDDNRILPNSVGEDITDPSILWSGNGSWWITNNSVSPVDTWQTHKVLIGPNSSYPFPNTRVVKMRPRMIFNYHIGGTTDGDQAVDAFIIEEAIDGTVITPEGIDAPNIRNRSLISSKIAVGAIGATELKAENALIGKLGITNVNSILNRDPGFQFNELSTFPATKYTYDIGVSDDESQLPWAKVDDDDAVYIVSDYNTAAVGDTALRCDSTDTNKIVFNNNFINIEEDKNYSIRIYYRDNTYNTSNNTVIKPFVVFYDKNVSDEIRATTASVTGWHGVYNSSNEYKLASPGLLPQNAWTLYEFNFGPKYANSIPIGLTSARTANYMRIGAVLNCDEDIGTPVSGTHEIALFEIREVTSGTLIEPGSITTEQLKVVSPGWGALNADPSTQSPEAWRYSTNAVDWYGWDHPNTIRYKSPTTSGWTLQTNTTVGNSLSYYNFTFSFPATYIRPIEEIAIRPRLTSSDDYRSYRLTFDFLQVFCHSGIKVDLRLKKAVGGYYTDNLNANKGIIESLNLESPWPRYRIIDQDNILQPTQVVSYSTTIGFDARSDVVLPTDVTAIGLIFCLSDGTLTTNGLGSASIGNVRLEELARTVSIEDGAITGDKLTANLVVSDEVMTSERDSGENRVQLSGANSADSAIPIYIGAEETPTAKGGVFSVNNNGDAYFNGAIDATEFESTNIDAFRHKLANDKYASFYPSYNISHIYYPTHSTGYPSTNLGNSTSEPTFGKLIGSPTTPNFPQAVPEGDEYRTQLLGNWLAPDNTSNSIYYRLRSYEEKIEFNINVETRLNGGIGCMVELRARLNSSTNWRDAGNTLLSRILILNADGTERTSINTLSYSFIATQEYFNNGVFIPYIYVSIPRVLTNSPQVAEPALGGNSAARWYSTTGTVSTSNFGTQDLS